MLSKKTEHGKDMEVQTVYKWTTWCGFAWWCFFVILFITFAAYRWDNFGEIKNQNIYQNENTLSYFLVKPTEYSFPAKFRLSIDK